MSRRLTRRLLRRLIRPLNRARVPARGVSAAPQPAAPVFRSFEERYGDQFVESYGDFHLGTSFEDLAITDLPKESGAIRGSIVHFVRRLPRPRRVLLPGEANPVRAAYAALLEIDDSAIVTTGLSPDVDVLWNFEEAPPALGRFDLAISQAMLEHLIDPYKHVRDLAALLEPGGHLVVLTVTPPFPYHRYPVDCVRFFPDWFEEVAQRLSLDVVDKHLGEARIVYVLRRS